MTDEGPGRDAGHSAAWSDAPHADVGPTPEVLADSWLQRREPGLASALLHLLRSPRRAAHRCRRLQRRCLSPGVVRCLLRGTGDGLFLRPRRGRRTGAEAGPAHAGDAAPAA